MNVDERYITARWETPDSGRKPKVYSLTSTGRTAATKHFGEWKLFSQTVDSIGKTVLTMPVEKTGGEFTLLRTRLASRGLSLIYASARDQFTSADRIAIEKKG